MSEEEDGLFGFDFDDDIFETEKEKKRPDMSQINYQAKVEIDGWFHTDKDIEELMLEQLGPNEVRSSIEHDYFHKKYQKALDKSLAFIHIAKTNDKCKVNGTKEMSEIALHCAAKLNQFGVMEELLNSSDSNVQDFGLYLTRGKFLPMLGQYAGAIDAYMNYHKERKSDYRVWSEMANVFMLSAERDCQKPVLNEMRYHFANLMMQRAIHIYTTCRWKQGIDFVKRRFEKDLKGLEERLKKSVDHKGDANLFVKWMSNDSPNKDESGLKEFCWDHIVHIYKGWALWQDLNLEDDTKAVKDL